MKVYRCILTNSFNQKFGDNSACVKLNQYNYADRPYKVVLTTGNTCPVGYAPFYTTVLGMKGHNGEDRGCYYKEPIYFSTEADTTWTASVEVDTEGGIGVDVTSDTPIFFETLPPQAGAQAKALWEKQGKKIRVKFRYHHLQSSLVKNGDKIKFGDKIALGDSTGASSGNHVHWSMKFVDENGKTLDSYDSETHNGYTGAVTFEKEYIDTFVQDEIKKRREIAKAIQDAGTMVSALAKLPVAVQVSTLSRLRSLLISLLGLIR